MRRRAVAAWHRGSPAAPAPARACAGPAFSLKRRPNSGSDALARLRPFSPRKAAAAMKKDEDFHPHYHMIKVVMTDGTTFNTYSTYGSDGDTLTLDVDPKTHPAWTGQNQHLVDRGGRLSRFKKKFEGIF